MNQARDTTAKLGCGTILLIGLVAAIFVRSGINNLESDVSELRGTIEALEATVEAQTDEMRGLTQRIDSLIARDSR